MLCAAEQVSHLTSANMRHHAVCVLFSTATMLPQGLIVLATRSIPALRVLGAVSVSSAMRCYSGTFREDNFQKAIGALTEAAAEAKGRPGAKSGKNGKRGGSNLAPDEKPDIYKIVRMCMERNYDPLIVFSFSKKECENLAKQVCRLLPCRDAASSPLLNSLLLHATV